jgi:beta-glucanase (GH16 family)
MGRRLSVRLLFAAVITFAGISGFAAPTSAKPSVDPSGQKMPGGDLPGWHQVFTDNFGTDVPLGSFPSAVSSKWTSYDGFNDTHGTGFYAPKKVVSVNRGVMNIYVHTENGQHLVAAPTPIIPGHSGAYDGLTYGRYAVRFRADPVAGYETAWLLWPDPDPTHPGGDWKNGEIDFPEGSLNGTINAFMHHRGDPTVQEEYHTGVTYSSWHTAVIEWTPWSVKFYLDGTLVGNDTNTAYLPNTPMHWILQTETAGTPPTDSAAGNVQVDWVSIWSRK